LLAIPAESSRRDTQEQPEASGALEMKSLEMKSYVVIFEKTDTGYSAYPPDLPGCGAAAATLDETKALIREAIEIYVEELEKAGYPVPEPTTLAEEYVLRA
jgi:predicted RNase H-like HicB family nuclease